MRESMKITMRKSINVTKRLTSKNPWGKNVRIFEDVFQKYNQSCRKTIDLSFYQGRFLLTKTYMYFFRMMNIIITKHKRLEILWVLLHQLMFLYTKKDFFRELNLVTWTFPKEDYLKRKKFKKIFLFFIAFDDSDCRCEQKNDQKRGCFEKFWH